MQRLFRGPSPLDVCGAGWRAQAAGLVASWMLHGGPGSAKSALVGDTERPRWRAAGFLT